MTTKILEATTRLLKNGAVEIELPMPKDGIVAGMFMHEAEDPVVPPDWVFVRFVKPVPTWKTALSLFFMRPWPRGEWITTFYRTAEHRGSNGQGLDLVFNAARTRGWVEGG